MLIILFAAIIIFLSAKSRFNRAHMEGSSTNYGGGCGGGSGGRGPAGRGCGGRGPAGSGCGAGVARAAARPGVGGGGAGGRGARVWWGPGLKHNNLLLLIPQLSPNHLHETRI